MINPVVTVQGLHKSFKDFHVLKGVDISAHKECQKSIKKCQKHSHTILNKIVTKN